MPHTFPGLPLPPKPKGKRERRMQERRMQKHYQPPQPYLFIGAPVKVDALTLPAPTNTSQYMGIYKNMGTNFGVFDMERCVPIIAEGGVNGSGFSPLVYQDELVTLDSSDIDIGHVSYVGHMHVDETEKGLLLMTVSSGWRLLLFCTFNLHPRNLQPLNGVYNIFL